jgi:hypothetical protein
MGWGENRRKKQTYTVESTFWMWKVYRRLRITQSRSTAAPAGLGTHPQA